MTKAVLLQHTSYFGPGRIVPLLRDIGIPVDLRRLDRGDEIPTDLEEIRLLLVLGGAMSVQDVGSSKYPFLQPEVELLKRMIALDRAVLGIGLGAQLLAFAAGAKVHPNVKPASAADDPPVPAPEYGWAPVSFAFPGGTEPVVFGLRDGMQMFHWHSDTFELPKLPPPANLPAAAIPAPTGSVLICSSQLCRNQAFRFKTRLFGFQYHFEFTAEDIEQVVQNEGETAARAIGAEAVRKIREETVRWYASYARAGNRIIANLVQFLKAY